MGGGIDKGVLNFERFAAGRCWKRRQYFKEES